MSIKNVFFWRQIFILITGLLYSTSIGYMFAFPSVIIPSLLSQNSTITATVDQTTWLAASNGLAGMIGFFILSPILQTWGRKPCNIFCNLMHLIGWIIFPLANNITLLFAARIIQGISIGGVYIQSMIFCELVDPQRRGYFATFKKTFMAVGTFGCHGMSLFWDWRQISTFAIILPALAISQTLLWPESPAFLALKGRFDECEKSFLWIHGSSKMKELNELITTQAEKQKKSKDEKFYNDLRRKEFWKPFVVVSLLTFILDLCGRYYYVVYIIQMLTELLGNKSLAIYCTLGADLLTIFALASSSLIIRYFKRRTVLFGSGFTSVSLMLLITLILVLKSYDIGTNLVWLTPSVLILQNFISNLGVIPVSFAFIGEVFPIKLRGLGSCATGIVFSSLYTITMKLTPFLMKKTGIQGTFGAYGIAMAICLLALYFVVPETKDKTLSQIEDELCGVKKSREKETNVLL